MREWGVLEACFIVYIDFNAASVAPEGVEWWSISTMLLVRHLIALLGVGSSGELCRELSLLTPPRKVQS